MDNEQNNLSVDEAKQIVKRFRLIAYVAAGVLATGTVFYHIVEKMRWVDSVYFSAVSLTTVGYGDYVPKTDLGKIFTIFYLFIGIAIITAMLTNILKSVVARRTIRHDPKK